MKKILSITMSLFIILGCFNIVAFADGNKISSSDVKKTREYVINWYNSGEHYYYGHCQGFVNQCWKRSLGGTWTSTCCAKKGWDTFGQSPSRDNIPVGASVYFARNSGSKCSSCGQYPGHVGFYIGNNEIIHVYNKVSPYTKMDDGSTAGYIRRTTIDAVINDGYTYLGWGYHSNRELEAINSHNHKYDASTETCTICGEKFSYSYTNINKTYKVTKNNVSLKSKPYQDYGTVYTKLKSGTKVTVNKSFKNVWGNRWYEVSYGNYTGYMYCENLEEYNEPVASTLAINMTDWPFSIKVGSSYGLRGSVKSNKTITLIEGFVQNSSGSNVLTSVDYPNKTSVDVKNANLNSKLTFNKLSAGDYKLIIKAYDNSGKCVTASKNFNVYSEQKKVDSSLSINLEKYPVSISQGSSYGLRGSVTSNYNVSEVRGYVINSSGNTVLSSKDYPNAKSMDIRYADLNNSLIFNKLGSGNYTMKVVAYDTSGRQVTATKDFTVQGSGGSSGGTSSSLSINMTSYPSSINKGSGFGLRGSVTSNCNITKVSGYVINSSGNTVLSSTDKPNSTSMDVRYANLNNDLVFNNLDSGSYTLKVVATDSSGKTKEWSSGFTVSGGQTASSNTRTGIVNIPSSWDNLSIRSGPSTNYQIVGSMNQGARCTVYTDKTSNGWYYVEYNGVKGYASGKQINLQ